MLDCSLISSELLESLMTECQAELRIAEELSKYLESHTIEELEDSTAISESRLIKLLALEGNPTLGELRNIAKALGKRLVIDFE